MGQPRDIALFAKMAKIRVFEERLLELFGEGKLHGTTHTYIGQEAIAVGLIDHLQPQDVIVSNHRCHGHFIARFDDPRALLCEITGKEGGVCEGRGGSQHLCHENFFSNGVQGGFVPIAAGMALAEKKRGSEAVVVAFIGDGTLGQGVLYESLNIISLLQLPMLIVVENNRYAQTTPVELNLAGSFVERFRAFGLPAEEVESNDVFELHDLFADVVDATRREGPRAQIVHTYRLKAHSKGDDDRDPAEIARWELRDPLVLASDRIGAEQAQQLLAEAREELAVIERDVDALPSSRLDPDRGVPSHHALRRIA